MIHPMCQTRRAHNTENSNGQPIRIGRDPVDAHYIVTFRRRPPLQNLPRHNLPSLFHPVVCNAAQ